MLSVFAAPVSCSAIRKSEVWQHARRQAILHRDHGRIGRRQRTARCGRSRARRHCLIVTRAAKADAAIHRELLAALEQQPDDLQEILVPADSNAVLGDATESGFHRARAGVFAQAGDIADRARTAPRSPSAVTPESSAVSGSIFSPSIAATKCPSLIRMMGQREPSRAKTDRQHLVARLRPRQRATQVQRVPAGQEAVDLEAPGAAPAPSGCGSRPAVISTGSWR